MGFSSCYSGLICFLFLKCCYCDFLNIFFVTQNESWKLSYWLEGQQVEMEEDAYGDEGELTYEVEVIRWIDWNVCEIFAIFFFLVIYMYFFLLCREMKGNLMNPKVFAGIFHGRFWVRTRIVVAQIMVAGKGRCCYVRARVVITVPRDVRQVFCYDVENYFWNSNFEFGLEIVEQNVAKCVCGED